MFLKDGSDDFCFIEIIFDVKAIKEKIKTLKEYKVRSFSQKKLVKYTLEKITELSESENLLNWQIEDYKRMHD